LYEKEIWRFKDSIEYEFKFKGEYGGKGSKRAVKVKPSPEQIEKANQRKRSKNMRRLLKANFERGDLWCTLKYPKGSKPSLEQIKKKDLNNFLRRLKRKYKNLGTDLKYIYRLEIGSQGGAHIHIVLNRPPGVDADLMIQEEWKPGRVNIEPVYDTEFTKLAEYIVKKPTEEIYKQLSFLPEEQQKEFIKFSSSRNLIRPEPEKKKYTRRTMEKLIKDGPTPSEGFYIDKNSIYYGINPFNGMTYFYYTELRGEDSGSNLYENNIESGWPPGWQTGSAPFFTD
jgi:hypothetical protein